MKKVDKLRNEDREQSLAICLGKGLEHLLRTIKFMSNMFEQYLDI